MSATAFQLIQQVYALGGEVSVDGSDLHVRAPAALPPELIQALGRQKPAVMVALGAPLDVATASVLSEIRAHLQPPLKDLSDAKLQILVNWSIMVAWHRALGTIDVTVERV